MPWLKQTEPEHPEADVSDPVPAVVWEGADALRPFLVPLDALEPFPGNPRQGDVESLRGSLRRFGQPRPILTDRGGQRIVAGHHVVQAARAEGWTHVAAIPNEFRTEEDARAFLLADNRLHDIGSGYDDQLLADALRALAETAVGLEGIGYDQDDVDAVFARLAKDSESSQNGQREHRDNTVKELVLLYPQERFEQVEGWVAIIAKELGVDGASEAVYEALRRTARELNLST